MDTDFCGKDNGIARFMQCFNVLLDGAASAFHGAWDRCNDLSEGKVNNTVVPNITFARIGYLPCLRCGAHALIS